MSNQNLPESIPTTTYEDVKNFLEREIAKAEANGETERAEDLKEVLADHLED